MKIHVAGVLFILWSIASSCIADEWPLPARKTFFSENRRFAVTIVPKQLAGQLEYFKDKVQGRQDAGAAEGIQDNHPRAFFYTVDPNGQLNFITVFKLVNEVAPVTALVSGDGQYLVTFDNWHSLGFGNDAIVIYRADGALIRSLSLNDVLTAKDIAVLPRSVSSIHWGEGHFIEESSHALVLRIERCTALDSCLKKPPQVAINLANGTPLRPTARDLLPHSEPTVSLRPVVTLDGQDNQVHSGNSLCASQPSFSRAPEAPFGSLQAAATELTLPSFTEVARRARLGGVVILEILVEDGAVTCVKTIKGLPMGLTETARTATLQWRFSPSPDHKGSVRSSVAFDFSFVEVQPTPEE